MAKKIGYVLLGLFLILAALAAIIQSPWGTRKAEEILVKSLSQWGLHIEVEKIEGALPREIALTNVKVETESFSLSIEKLRVQFSLLRLLKRELAINDLLGEGISWREKGGRGLQEGLKKEAAKLPFLLKIDHFVLKRVSGFDAEGTLRVGRKTRYAFLDTTVTRPEFPDACLHARVSLRRTGIAQMRLDLKTPDTRAIPLLSLPKGSLFLDLFAQGRWTNLLPFLNVKETIQGRFFGEFLPESSSTPWAFSSRFQRKEDLSWTFSRIRAKSDLLQIGGQLAVTPEGEIDASWLLPKVPVGPYSILAVTGHGHATWKQGVLEGVATSQGELFSKPWELQTQFSAEKDSPLILPSYTIKAPSSEITGHLAFDPETFLPTGRSYVQIGQLQEIGLPDLFGSVDAEVLWEKQNVTIDGRGVNLYWKDLFAQSATFHADLRNFSATTLDLNLHYVQKKSLTLETASLQTEIGGENWPFHLFLEGEWKHPLALDLDGFWRLEKQNLLITLQDATGSFFNYPLSLAEPVTFTTSPLQLTPLELHVADATLLAELSQGIHLTLQQFPIDFFSLNPLDVSVSGLIDLDLTLNEQEGAFRASVESSHPLNASGHFEGTYRDSRFDIKGDLATHNAPLLALDASVPMRLEFWPFKVEFLPSESIKGHLAMQGRVEDFLDFFDLGTHHLEGLCRCNLTLGNTLEFPTLEGTCTLEKGLYQNYYTGTQLENLSARLVAKDHTLTLESLSAQDLEQQGTLSATGTVSLDLPKQFPFHFDTLFSNLRFLQIPLVAATASGEVQVMGNLNQATARGDLKIAHSELTIPDKIPRLLPDLEVIYRNAIKPVAPPLPKKRKRYPLFLDLNVHAPQNITISGRGLNTEWGGTFHLGGTYDALKTQGQIQLIKGEFLFSSRSFKLTEGSLSFTGAEKEMPYLNLSGSTEAKGTTITARLRGPLNNPQLTLHSTPPLPLSSILSLLLFGQDLSEINSFQALQLVNSLASIAGEGPDVLEKTRKALGVDRLRIITLPSQDDEEGETIAVQVGKYVAEGVIVTFSQGAEDNGPNIGVEVELKHGFSFQIETQQKQEQGKFILKWGTNY